MPSSTTSPATSLPDAPAPAAPWPGGPVLVRRRALRPCTRQEAEEQFWRACDEADDAAGAGAQATHAVKARQLRVTHLPTAPNARSSNPPIGENSVAFGFTASQARGSGASAGESARAGWHPAPGTPGNAIMSPTRISRVPGQSKVLVDGDWPAIPRRPSPRPAPDPAVSADALATLRTVRSTRGLVLQRHASALRRSRSSSSRRLSVLWPSFSPSESGCSAPSTRMTRAESDRVAEPPFGV